MVNSAMTTTFSDNTKAHLGSQYCFLLETFHYVQSIQYHPCITRTSVATFIIFLANLTFILLDISFEQRHSIYLPRKSYGSFLIHLLSSLSEQNASTVSPSLYHSHLSVSGFLFRKRSDYTRFETLVFVRISIPPWYPPIVVFPFLFSTEILIEQ